jgi:bacteriorhodopsin
MLSLTLYVAGVIFVALLIVQLAQRFEGANDIHKTLNIIVIVVLVAYPIVWLLGSEGTATLGLSQEVRLSVQLACQHQQHDLIFKMMQRQCKRVLLYV